MEYEGIYASDFPLIYSHEHIIANYDFQLYASDCYIAPESRWLNLFFVSSVLQGYQGDPTEDVQSLFLKISSLSFETSQLNLAHCRSLVIFSASFDNVLEITVNIPSLEYFASVELLSVKFQHYIEQIIVKGTRIDNIHFTMPPKLLTLQQCIDRRYIPSESLEYLELSYCSREHFKVSEFPLSLKYLNLTATKLTEFPDLRYLTRLETLVLSSNRVNFDYLLVPQCLIELIMEDCFLTETPVFSQLHSLKLLSLQGNSDLLVELSMIPAQVTELNLGEVMGLDFNFSHLTQLTTLYLNNTPISKEFLILLPQGLTKLELSNTALTHFPNLTHFHNLKSCNLSLNDFRTFQTKLVPNSLTEINISKCPISFILVDRISIETDLYCNQFVLVQNGGTLQTPNGCFSDGFYVTIGETLLQQSTILESLFQHFIRSEELQYLLLQIKNSKREISFIGEDIVKLL